MPEPTSPREHGAPVQIGLAAAPETEATPSVPVSEAHTTQPTRLQIWIHRLLVLLFVFVCAAAGVLLVVLPWTLQWTDNVFLVRYPELRAIITSGFFRGLCSGLGLLDIWIGFSEAIHYHEDKLPDQ